MADKKKYLETFTSPAGEAVYPWITKADTAHEPLGVFHTDLSLPQELAQPFIDKLEKVRDDFASTLNPAQAAALTPRPVFQPEYTRPVYPEGADADEKAAIKQAHVPELTGNVLFRFKLKAKVQPKNGEAFSQAPIVVTADTGEKVDTPVFGGSIIRVRGQIVPYTNVSAGNYGVTLRLKAVQVIELVTGDGSGSTFWTDGFNDEDAA